MREYSNEQLNGLGDSVDGKSSLGPAEGYSDGESPTQCIITYRYKRGNVEFEMQPINGGQDGDEDVIRTEEGRSGRLNGDTRSYTPPRFEDVEDDRSPLGPRCIKEEKPCMWGLHSWPNPARSHVYGCLARYTPVTTNNILL